MMRMKMRMRNCLSVVLALLLVIGAIGLGGCAKNNGNNNGSPDGETKLENQDYRVTLFFANEDYIETGDESLEKFMVYEKEITTTPDLIYKETLEALKTTPGEGYGTMITKNIKLNDVYLDGSTAVVDLSDEGLSGSSMEETYLISQIVDTFIQSFVEVDQVRFLINGEPADSLMGHFDASKPFTKDLFTE